MGHFHTFPIVMCSITRLFFFLAGILDGLPLITGKSALHPVSPFYLRLKIRFLWSRITITWFYSISYVTSCPTLDHGFWILKVWRKDSSFELSYPMKRIWRNGTLFVQDVSLSISDEALGDIFWCGSICAILIVMGLWDLKKFTMNWGTGSADYTASNEYIWIQLNLLHPFTLNVSKCIYERLWTYDIYIYNIWYIYILYIYNIYIYIIWTGILTKQPKISKNGKHLRWQGIQEVTWSNMSELWRGNLL